MNLLTLARVAEQLTQASITVEAKRCLHARDKSSTCDVCLDVCPAGAIQVDRAPQVDADACVRCGVCLHACPTGVFDGNDGVYRMLYCVSQLVDHERLELACSLHPDAARGNSGVDTVVCASGCLAAFGASAYVSLAALGVQSVQVRLDACAQCPITSLKPEIERSIAQADTLLATLEKPITVKAITAQPAERKRRTIVSVKNPPVSRRAFFRTLTRQTVTQASDIMPGHAPQIEGQKSSPRERRRLIRALRLLAPARMDEPVNDDGFTRLSASVACTACEVCTRICPTGALTMQVSEEQFSLEFSAAECINCGQCLKLCRPAALARDGVPSLSELLSDEKTVLRAGPLRRCSKCHAPYAGEDDLCPVCAFRRNTPFGHDLSRTISGNLRDGT